MSTGYTVWQSSDGLLKMMEFEPEYFKECVSTETKDRAKERGLAHFDEERWKIVLNDGPGQYGDLVERSGLEDYLQERLNGTV